MSRKKATMLTNGEHRIMEVIWAMGSATVAEVVEALDGKDQSQRQQKFVELLAKIER